MKEVNTGRVACGDLEKPGKYGRVGCSHLEKESKHGRAGYHDLQNSTRALPRTHARACTHIHMYPETLRILVGRCHDDDPGDNDNNT